VKHERDEEALRARYGELRAESARSGSLPDFDAMMARAKDEAAGTPRLDVVEGGPSPAEPIARPSRRAKLAAGWVTLAAAALAGLLLARPPAPDADAEFERLVASYAADAGSWRSPTAGLLDIPGVDLGAVPSIAAPTRGARPVAPPPPDGRDS
jgi:hypothetical protein